MLVTCSEQQFPSEAVCTSFVALFANTSYEVSHAVIMFQHLSEFSTFDISPAVSVDSLFHMQNCKAGIFYAFLTHCLSNCNAHARRAASFHCTSLYRQQSHINGFPVPSSCSSSDARVS